MRLCTRLVTHIPFRIGFADFHSLIPRPPSQRGGGGGEEESCGVEPGTEAKIFRVVIFGNPCVNEHFSIFLQGSIDSTRVTCVKWVPGSENTFVSSHRSGNLYVWSSENTSKTTGQQNYSPHKVIQDATIHTVKPKNKASVIYRWAVGHGAINSFSFSPDLTHIAIASQDGFLRVYDFHKQELYGRMRSYFGGLLSVCWSPDGRYAVTGGEDDLVNVWSFEHRKVVARGEGHKSYVSVVAFDPYTTVIPNAGFSASSRLSVCSSEDGTSTTPGAQASVGAPKAPIDPSSTASSPYLGRLASESAADLDRVTVAYRLGSIGQDTQLCLWDLSGDALKLRRQFSRSRSRMSRQASRPVSTGDVLASSPAEGRTGEEKQKSAAPQESGEHHRLSQPDESVSKSVLGNHVSSSQGASTDSPQTTDKAPEQSLSSKPENDSLSEGKESSPSVASEHSSEKSSEKGSGKKEKKSKKDKEKDKEKEKEKTKDEEHSKRKNSNKTVKLMTEPVRKVMRFVGGGVGHAYRREVRTFETCNSDDIASKMYEVNLIEPLVAKKISQERLTALVFREDCIVTACQEGFVQTWARPSTVLPAEATAEDAASKHTTSAASSHPGVR